MIVHLTTLKFLHPTLIIPEGCRRIGRSAFENCTGATIILNKHNRAFKGFEFDAFLGVRDVKEETRA